MVRRSACHSSRISENRRRYDCAYPESSFGWAGISGTRRNVGKAKMRNQPADNRATNRMFMPSSVGRPSVPPSPEMKPT